ncbi:MAG: hypothetical protein PVI67_14370, partial [Anaerolineae bacterium]
HGMQQLFSTTASPSLLPALYPISSSLSSSFDNYQAIEYNRSVCLMVDTKSRLTNPEYPGGTA